MNRVILIAIISFAGYFAANAQWEKCKNQMSYYHALGISIDGNNIFVGAGSITTTNGIYLSTDNGDTWIGKDSTRQVMNTIAIKDSDIYAGGRGGYIDSTHYAGFIASTDYGNSWREVKNGLPDTTVNSIVIKGNMIFAGTAVGLYLSTNKGNSWVIKSNGLPNTGVSSILINGDSIFIGTYQEGIFLSTDDGNLWVEKNNGLEYKYYPRLCKKGNSIFAGTMWGIFLSTDAGNSWARRDTGLAENHIQTIYANEKMIFAGTVNRGLAYSTNNGDIWIQDSELFYQFISTIAVSSDYVFVGDMGGGLYRSKISDLITGVNDIPVSSNRDLNIFPNPSTDFIEIKINESLYQYLSNKIDILNIFGTCISSHQMTSAYRLSIESLPPGLYFVWIGDKVSKFLKY